VTRNLHDVLGENDPGVGARQFTPRFSGTVDTKPIFPSSVFVKRFCASSSNCSASTQRADGFQAGRCVHERVFPGSK
jgi:hypothetical protein